MYITSIATIDNRPVFIDAHDRRTIRLYARTRAAMERAERDMVNARHAYYDKTGTRQDMVRTRATFRLAMHLYNHLQDRIVIQYQHDPVKRSNVRGLAGQHYCFYRRSA